MAKKVSKTTPGTTASRTRMEQFTSPDSTSIVMGEYDTINSILYVTFKHGKRYSHEKFPRTLWAKFVKAESKGRFYNEFIRDNYTSAVA